MGWASATALFDGAVDVVIEQIKLYYDWADITDKEIARAVKSMYTEVDWNDWDTQDESKYWKYLVEVMHDLGELDDEEYQWQKDNNS